MLIAGLRDSRMYTRSLCIRSLTEATGDSRGYDPGAEEDARARAVTRWETWWLARTGEGLLESLQR